MKKYWFVFNKSNLLLEKTAEDLYTIPFQDNPPVKCDNRHIIHTITPLGRNEVRTFRTDKDVFDSEKYEMCDLRSSYNKLPEPLYLKAGKCEEILYWDDNNRYCGICGHKLRMNTDISKKCDNCGKEIWPQLSTAVIVLIHRGDEVLLVHAKNFRGDFFGLVAGFVETGETLEQAVIREVKEETSLDIKNIRYFASQPWPYPCGLMVGFYAEYAGGEITLQRSELTDGGWFKRDKLPQIPAKLSIARRLIDNWLNNGNR